MVSVHGCLVPCTWDNIMAVEVCGKGNSPHGGQETVRKGPGIIFKDTSPPVTYFLSVGLT
jgi:hypothetical protein